MKTALAVAGAASLIALGAWSMATAQKPTATATPGDCASMINAPVRDGKVTAAAMVQAPPAPVPAAGASPAAAAPAAGQAPGRPQATKTYCRVQITVKPDPGSNIRIELWLPNKADWNGKFLGTGNGGAAGVIATSALVAGVNRGYATANTDMGSSSGKGGLNFGFGIGRPDLQNDFNFRSTDAMTTEGKALTILYYGQRPKYSYFQGCSTGGGQAWEQIQHLPDAYNGVIAGAPANQRPDLHMVRIWDEWNNLKTPEATVSKEKMALVTRLAVDQCDKLDGLKDGIISDPRECHVDLKPVMCKKDADAPDCLTKAQAATVQAVWHGPSNPRTKARVYWGFEPGSESAIDLHWGAKTGPNGQVIVSDNLINWSQQYQEAHPDGVGFDFDKDVARADQDLRGANWTDTKLDAFRDAGGKVIIYHGWADGLVPSAGTVAYYEDIAKANGGYDKTKEFARLFMVPGMGHCRGGVGPDQFDMLTELEHWVEHDVWPDKVVATRPARDGLPAIKRPLCAYPSIEKYLGDGDPNDLDNFVCGRPAGMQAWSSH